MKLPLRHQVTKVHQKPIFQSFILGVTLCLGAFVAIKYYSEQTQPYIKI